MEGFIFYLSYAFYFIVVVFLAFFIPGNLFVRSFKLTLIQKITSSILLGISLWALQGFIFGYLNLRFLTYAYLILTTIVWLKLNYQNLIPNLKIKKIKKEDLIIPVIFLIGCSLQFLTIIANAIPIKEGLFFCCGGADILYHAALSNELIGNFPPNEPGIYGVALNNYHFLSNLAISELVRIFKLPILITEFHFIPILLTLLLGLSAYTLSSILKLGKSYVIFFLILIFFFADILYLLTLFTTKSLNFNVVTIETSLSLWVSYTRYFGVVLFFQGLTFLYLWIQNKNLKYLIPLFIVGGTLIGFKVYIGLLFLAGCGGLILYFLIKRDIKAFFSLCLLFALSALVFLPVNGGSGGLIFTGFWRVQDFVVNPTLNLSHLELARRIFVDNANPKRYIFDLLFLAIYIFFSFGILLTAFLNTPKNLKKIPLPINLFLIIGFLTTFVIGMFFIQKTGGANSSQFLISSYLILPIYAALFLNYLYQHKIKFLKLVILLFLLLTIPKAIHITYTQINIILNHEYDIVDNDTLNSFKYINKNFEKNTIIIVDPKLKNICIILPFMTHARSYSCKSGSPSDRGLDLKTKDSMVSKALKGKTNKEGIGIKYILTSQTKINGKHHRTIYKNNSLKILKYE